MFLDVSLCACLWKLIKSTSRFERISCFVVSLLVISSITILAYYFIVKAKIDINNDVRTAPAPTKEWLVSRETWQDNRFKPYNITITPSTTPYEPLKLVIVQYETSKLCFDYEDCKERILWLLYNHNYYGQRKARYDIRYNFLIPYDNRVYEGRGWGKVGQDNTTQLDACALTVAFVGDSTFIDVYPLQLIRLKLLLAKGVSEGYLHPQYSLIGINDILDTRYPGPYITKAIRDFIHYDHKNNYRNMTCEEVQEYTMNDFENE